MKNNSKIMITTVAFIATILLALFIGDIGDNIRALIRILEAPGILLTDPLSINRDYGGNLNALIANLFLTTGLSLLVVKFSKAPFEGGVIASIFTVAGFTFIGKNVLNVIPLYVGVMLYSKFKKTELKDSMIALLLSSGFAPIVSYLIFGLGVSHIHLGIRLPMAITVGIIAGFFIPMIAAHAINFHKGFNLYNVGFTMGLLAVGAHGILRSFGIHVQPVGAPLEGYPDHTWFLMLAIAALSIGMIILAFIYDKNVIEKYKLILKETGQLSSNFSQIGGQPATMLNMGILGVISLILLVPILIIVDIPFLGILGAGVFTIIGFGAFGKHPLNTLPIFAGTILGFFVISMVDSPFTNLLPTDNPNGAYRSSISIHAYTGAILFATTLAPLSKEFGWKAGVIAGFYHMMIVVIGGNFQGGFNLYNNGWMGGFVVATTMPIFAAFKEKRSFKKKLT
jgi:hypothetical protein